MKYFLTIFEKIITYNITVTNLIRDILNKFVVKLNNKEASNKTNIE